MLPGKKVIGILFEKGGGHGVEGFGCDTTFDYSNSVIKNTSSPICRKIAANR